MFVPPRGFTASRVLQRALVGALPSGRTPATYRTFQGGIPFRGAKVTILVFLQPLVNFA